MVSTEALVRKEPSCFIVPVPSRRRGSRGGRAMARRCLLPLSLGVTACSSLPTDFAIRVPATALAAAPALDLLAPGDLLEVNYFKSYGPQSSYLFEVGDVFEVRVRSRPPKGAYRLAVGDSLQVVIDFRSSTEAYVLEVGDKIRLHVPNQPELSREVAILPDGDAVLPRVGGVRLRGLTVAQATQELSKRFSQILDQPRVDVSVEQLGRENLRQTVDVLPDGRATLPWAGAVDLRGKTTEEAVADLTERYRKLFKEAKVDLLVLDTAAPDLEHQTSVLPDGRATLPMVGTVTMRGRTIEDARTELTQRYTEHFVDPVVDVLVTRSNARLDVFFDTLAKAGGGTMRAVRVDENGEVVLPLVGAIAVGGQRIAAAAKRIRAAYLELDAGLDVSAVIRQKRPTWITVLGEVNRGGKYESDHAVTPMEALAMAGGFSDRAWLDQVIVMRPESDGALQVRVLDLDTALEMDNPGPLAALIQPNDIVYVPRSPIADVNVFIEQYIRGVWPIEPYIGIGFGYTVNGND